MRNTSFGDAATIPVPECGQRLTRNRLSGPFRSYDLIFQINNLEALLSSPSLAISMQGRKCEGSSPFIGVFVIAVLSYFELLAERNVRARAIDKESEHVM